MFEGFSKYLYQPLGPEIVKTRPSGMQWDNSLMKHRGRQIRPPATQSRRARAQPEGSRTADCASTAYSSKKIK